MDVKGSEIKQIIVNKMVNSSINITPVILNFIANLRNPLEKVNVLIKETSFIPNFNSHLTLNILNKVSDKEIVKALHRTLLIKETTTIEKNDGNPLEPTKSLHIEEQTVTITDEPEKLEELECFLESPNNAVEVLALETNTIPPAVLKSQKRNKIRKEKKEKMLAMGSTSSTLAFKPIAKEYKTEYEILKDPTGKIHTNGLYNDFYEMTQDKFNRLQVLMKKRIKRDGNPFPSTIVNILRNTRSQSVSTMGLVDTIRETKKGNYFITLEDNTGKLNIIIKGNSETTDKKEIESIISDQMLFVSGTYNPGEKGKLGIFFADYFTKIGIKPTFEPNLSPDPLSIALLSDLHVGSREFEEDLWNRFIKFINGKLGNSKKREIAGKIKYIIINGDLVDGIGIYPSQKEDLIITDIFQQFKKASELLSKIPDYIKIIFSSGNHDPVRNAIPRPAVPKKYTEELLNMGVKCVGNPAIVKTHNVKTLVFHGDSMIDMSMLIAGLEVDKPGVIMKEFLTCRHLAPIYGKKTQIAPISKDWLVIDEIPDIFHTGHTHINGIDKFNNVSLINSGCFQSQTDFMASLGIHPTPGKVPIVELDTYHVTEMDFKSQ